MRPRLVPPTLLVCALLAAGCGDDAAQTADAGVTRVDASSAVDASVATDADPNNCQPPAEPDPPPSKGIADGPPYIPSACRELLVYPDACDDAGRAQLVLDGVTFELDRACGGPLILEDFSGHVLQGAFLTFAPAEGCSPLVSIALADGARHGDPPFDVDLSEPMCLEPASRLFNVSVYVERDGECLGRFPGATGQMQIRALDEVVAHGTVTSQLRPLDGGAVSDFSLEFDMGLARTVTGIQALFDGDLCQPPPP